MVEVTYTPERAFFNNVKGKVDSFTVVGGDGSYSFATRPIGAGKVVYVWSNDYDGTKGSPEIAAYVTHDGRIVAGTGIYLKRIGVLGDDYRTPTIEGLVPYEKMEAAAKRLAADTAEKFYDDIAVDPDVCPDERMVRWSFIYRKFRETPDFKAFTTDVDAEKWILGLQDIKKDVTEAMEEARDRLMLEKGIDEFLKRAVDSGNIPEEIALPWEIRILDALDTAEADDATNLAVHFTAPDGAEVTLHTTADRLRQEIRNRTEEADRWWHLNAWQFTDGRPKAEKAAETLGGWPRVSDISRITYGRKVLYEKEKGGEKDA